MVVLILDVDFGFVSTHKHIFNLGNISDWVLLCCFHFLPILMKDCLLAQSSFDDSTHNRVTILMYNTEAVKTIL